MFAMAMKMTDLFQQKPIRSGGEGGEWRSYTHEDEHDNDNDDGSGRSRRQLVNGARTSEEPARDWIGSFTGHVLAAVGGFSRREEHVDGS